MITKNRSAQPEPRLLLKRSCSPLLLLRQVRWPDILRSLLSLEGKWGRTKMYFKALLSLLRGDRQSWSWKAISCINATTCTKCPKCSRFAKETWRNGFNAHFRLKTFTPPSQDLSAEPWFPDLWSNGNDYIPSSRGYRAVNTGLTRGSIKT